MSLFDILIANYSAAADAETHAIDLYQTGEISRAAMQAAVDAANTASQACTAYTGSGMQAPEMRMGGYTASGAAGDADAYPMD